MKKCMWLVLILMAAAFCVTAGAEWYCANVGRDGTLCGTVNQDGCKWCLWCGEDEPVHGLYAGKIGENVIQLKWYGVVKEPMSLWWCVSGTDSWDCAANVTGNSFILMNLQPGTAYDIQLILADGTERRPITVTTAMGYSPTPTPTLPPTPTPTLSPTPTPTLPPTPTPTLPPTSTPTLSPTPTPTPTPVPARIGQTITFGRYPQMAYGTDSTPIEWQVLDVYGNRALVISRYGLDAHRFDVSQYQGWEWSEVRSWLNSTFLNRAFTAAQQQAIITTLVDNSSSQGNPNWYKTGGYDTHDKLFLLSFAEANQYFRSDEGRKCIPTAYAVYNGVDQYRGSETSDKLNGTGCCMWWLRSPGNSVTYVSYIRRNGGFQNRNVSGEYCAVRPAMWIDLCAMATCR